MFLMRISAALKFLRSVSEQKQKLVQNRPCRPPICLPAVEDEPGHVDDRRHPRHGVARCPFEEGRASSAAAARARLLARGMPTRARWPTPLANRSRRTSRPCLATNSGISPRQYRLRTWHPWSAWVGGGEGPAARRRSPPLGLARRRCAPSECRPRDFSSGLGEVPSRPSSAGRVCIPRT